MMVTPVNDAPTAANNTIDVVMNEDHTFDITDFGFKDAIDNDKLQSIRMNLTDPENLRIKGLTQTNNQVVITARQVEEGLVTYKAGSIGITKTIEYTVIDDGDTQIQTQIMNHKKITSMKAKNIH